MSRTPSGPGFVPSSASLATMVLLTWLLLLGVTAARALPLPQIGFAQDVGVMLDAGWRYYQGQRTHADYHSPLGPMFGILFGLPLKLGGPTYDSLKLLPPAITALFTLWTIAVTSRSLPPAARMMLAAGVGSAAGGIFHLGFPVEALSFAVFYNRVGFGLLCLIGLAALLPRAETLPKWTAVFRDASIGVALAMLLFLKVNFFLAAGPFVLLALALHRRSRGEWLACALSFAAACWFFLHDIGYRIDRMAFDLAMAADARRACLDSFFFPLRNLISNHDFAMLLALQTVGVLPLMLARQATAWTTAASLAGLWGPAALGFALTLMQSHGDGRGIPLVLVGMAVCLARLPLPPTDVNPPRDGRMSPTRGVTPETQARLMSTACLVLAAALFVLPHAYSYAQWAAVSRNPGPRQFRAPAIRNLYVGSFGNNLGPDAVVKMNDAHDLLSRHAKPGDSLQYMDMNNIYTYAEQLRSPRKSMLFWDSRSSYTVARHPPAEDFADTDLIMAPKQRLTIGPLETDWWTIYAIDIEDRYDLVEETDFFKLWRRSRDKPPGRE